MKPGYRFFTAEMSAWLGHYKPVIANKLCNAAGHPVDPSAAARLREGQRRGTRAGKAARDAIDKAKAK